MSGKPMGRSSALPLTPDGLIRRFSLLFGPQAKEVERFIKFSIVGAIGAVVDFGTGNLLLHILRPTGFGITLVSAVAFTAAVTSNFIWNRYWTYPDSRSKRLAPQLAQFFAVNVMGLGIRLVILNLTREPLGSLGMRLLGPDNDPVLLGYNLATALAIGIVMFWNFFVNRYWTYNDVDRPRAGVVDGVQADEQAHIDSG